MSSASAGVRGRSRSRSCRTTNGRFPNTAAIASPPSNESCARGAAGGQGGAQQHRGEDVEGGRFVPADELQHSSGGRRNQPHRSEDQHHQPGGRRREAPQQRRTQPHRQPAQADVDQHVAQPAEQDLRPRVAGQQGVRQVRQGVHLGPRPRDAGGQRRRPRHPCPRRQPRRHGDVSPGQQHAPRPARQPRGRQECAERGTAARRGGPGDSVRPVPRRRPRPRTSIGLAPARPRRPAPAPAADPAGRSRPPPPRRPAARIAPSR